MKMTVRFVEDVRSGKCWFEEQLTNHGDQWCEIKSTVAACEGNSRYALSKEIEKRRQQNLAIYRNYGEPQEFVISEEGA